MAGKFASIDFNKCAVRTCVEKHGFCPAAKVCPHKLLEQEDEYDPPMLLSVTMCVGCGDCLRACAPGAITIQYK